MTDKSLIGVTINDFAHNHHRDDEILTSKREIEKRKQIVGLWKQGFTAEYITHKLFCHNANSLTLELEVSSDTLDTLRVPDDDGLELSVKDTVDVIYNSRLKHVLSVIKKHGEDEPTPVQRPSQNRRLDCTVKAHR